MKAAVLSSQDYPQLDPQFPVKTKIVWKLPISYIIPVLTHLTGNRFFDLLYYNNRKAEMLQNSHAATRLFYSKVIPNSQLSAAGLSDADTHAEPI